jgi:hypothetical protein
MIYTIVSKKSLVSEKSLYAMILYFIKIKMASRFVTKTYPYGIRSYRKKWREPES